MTLSDRIVQYLQGNPSTSREIARALHIRHATVLSVLRTERFQKVEDATRPAARVYVPKRGGTAGNTPNGHLNRAEAMLRVLRDRHWHSRRDIFARAGTFMLTNNAASELRAKGYDVAHRRQGNEYQYRLLSPPTGAAREADSAAPVPSQVAA